MTSAGEMEWLRLVDASDRAYEEGRYEVAECWRCNPGNWHLRQSESLIECPVCERFWFRGENVTEDGDR